MITITHYNCLLYILSFVHYKHSYKCLSLKISISNIYNIALLHNVGVNMKIDLNKSIGPCWNFILIVYSIISTHIV